MASPTRVGVAYSGGRDSTALLHAACVAATSAGIEIVALHVHHGLSPQADRWLDHCRRHCAARAPVPVKFVATRLVRDDRKGESVEAWARRGRYRELAAMARAEGVGEVLLAHHRRDQAETLMLQALRGGGLAGLAAMPGSVVRDGIRWRRPWLDRTRDEIDAYLVRHRLATILDDTNDDRRYDRNRLRLQVWPELSRAFPAAERALATAAAWAQEAVDLAEEIAALDLAATAPEGRLAIEPWGRLSPARRSNALRAWLKQTLGASAPSTLVVRLLRELPGRPSGRWAASGGELRLFDGLLAWAPVVTGTVVAAAGERELCLAVAAAGRHTLAGWGGVLVVEPAGAGEAGLPLAALAAVELRVRSGGERFRWGPGRPSRELKKQFQQAGVPEWRRDVPLLYAHGRLVFVPGLGIDGDALCATAEDRPMRLRWEPL